MHTRVSILYVSIKILDSKWYLGSTKEEIILVIKDFTTKKSKEYVNAP